jgi:CheY-like chemotaxis protein
VPYTLLLADDSVTIQRVIELTFADEDVTVIAVSDGDQAIERLEASPPDIVLADIGMPGRNGYEVAQYIRQSPRLSHIPVVLLTGAFEPVDQARANAAGCDGVLAKPFEPQLVISRVKELLARGHHGPDAPGPVPSRAIDSGDLALPSSSDSIWAPPLSEQHRPATPFIGHQRAVAPFADQPIAAEPTGPVPRTELNDYFDRLDAAFSTLSAPPGQIAQPARPAVEPAPFVPFEIDTDIDWFGTNKAEGGSAEPWDLPAPPADVAPVDLPLVYPPPAPEPPHTPPFSTPPFAPEIEYVVAAEDEPAEEVAHRAEPEPVPAPAVQVAPGVEEPVIAPVVVEPAAAPVVAASVVAQPILAAAPPAPVVTAVPALELPLPNPPPLPALADAFAALLAAEQSDPLASFGGTWPAAVPETAAVTDALLEDVTRRVLERLSDTVVFREAVAEATSKIADRLVREEIARIKASIK